MEPAQVADLPALYRLLDRANTHALGLSQDRQWNRVELAHMHLQKLTERGECYVMKDDQGQLLGSVSVANQDVPT